MSAELTDAERETKVRWIVAILRTYGVAEHQADQIAECLFDDGVTALDSRAAVAAASAPIEALADEFEATGERLQGVPAAQTWLLVSARLRAALAGGAS